MRDGSYKLLIKKFGEPSDSRPAPQEVIDKYRSILPANVIHYWETEGFCQFRNGLFFSVNPDDWQFVVDAWIKGTPYAKLGPFFALTRSAFGKIYLFNEKIGATTKIDAAQLSIYSYDIEPTDQRGRETSAGMVFHPRPEDIDVFDSEDRPLFERALAKLGPVGWDEMYAFEPALAMGGSQRLENLAKLDWRVHMMLLREIEDPHVPFMEVKIPSGI